MKPGVAAHVVPMGVETPLTLQALAAFARLSLFCSASRVEFPAGVLV